MEDRAERLRLLVRDSDDLAVASTLLQDAIIPGADLRFIPRERQFILIANRFCWEAPTLANIASSDGKPVHERRLCALRVAEVLSAQRSNWPQPHEDALFNLLALSHGDMAEDADGKAWLQFDFSGGARLRLAVERLEMLVADLEAGHFTSLRPTHDL